MLRTGCIAISIWAGINLLLALAIVVSLAFFGQNAPALALSFSPSEVAALDPRALATVNAVASIANGACASLCGLALFATWHGVARGSRWALVGVGGALAFVQATGFLSDSYLGHMNLGANLVSTALLAVGLVCAALGRARGLGDHAEPVVFIPAVTRPPVSAPDA